MNSQSESMEIQSTTIGHGWRWVKNAFDLFKEQPFLWIGMIIIIWVCLAAASFVPVVGYLAVNLIQPVFAAGLYLAVNKEANNPPATIGQVFDGFKTNVNQLLMLGLVYMIAIIILMIPVLITFFHIVGDSDFAAYSQQFGDQQMQLQQFEAIMHNTQDSASLLLAFLIALAFYIPLLMAYYFAPLLIAIEDMRCFEAMKFSFIACIRNIMPFFWFSIIATFLLIIASIPFFLGLILVVPLLALTTYTAYQDIFCKLQNETSAM